MVEKLNHLKIRSCLLRVRLVDENREIVAQFWRFLAARQTAWCTACLAHCQTTQKPLQKQWKMELEKNGCFVGCSIEKNGFFVGCSIERNGFFVCFRCHLHAAKNNECIARVNANSARNAFRTNSRRNAWFCNKHCSVALLQPPLKSFWKKRFKITKNTYCPGFAIQQYRH